MIAEIQQNSNTTYRVFDYGRVGADGKPRALHIDKAMDVTHLGPCSPQAGAAGETTKKRRLRGYAARPVRLFYDAGSFGRSCARFTADKTSFHSLLFLDGEALLFWDADFSGGHRMELTVRKGDSILIPAALGSYDIKGNCEFLLTTV